MEQKMKKPVPPELRRAIRFKKRKKIFENVRISIATVIAAFFTVPDADRSDDHQFFHVIFGDISELWFGICHK